MNRVIERFKKDYLLRSKGKIYEEFLSFFTVNNYTISSLNSCVKNFNQNERFLALRHDVDINNVAGNESFFEIEHKLGVKSTFYFRLQTIKQHKLFINKLLKNNFEVGFHFEEAATIAKRAGVKDFQELKLHEDLIFEEFAKNIAFFRKEVSNELRTISAHGDWINRQLGFSNYFFTPQSKLNDLSIEFEAYNSKTLNENFHYLTDTEYSPDNWNYKDLLGKNVYSLTHERSWYPGKWANTKANVHRIIDELFFYFKPF